MIELKDGIDLDNGYTLKIVKQISDLPVNLTDMANLKLKEIKKKGKLLLKIDFNQLKKETYKKILKKLLVTKKILIKKKIKIGMKEEEKILLGYVVNYDEKKKEQTDFLLAVNAIFYPNRLQRYEYIYDTVCDYLDSYFYGKNLCDFQNNQCGEKRNTSSHIGCCHHFKIKWLGPFTKLVPCEYLEKDYTCGAKCISCKLFTCDYLKKKEIQFKIKDILLLDVFFNPLQKYFIKYMVFTPKEKIIKRLMIT